MEIQTTSCSWIITFNADLSSLQTSLNFILKQTLKERRGTTGPAACFPPYPQCAGVLRQHKQQCMYIRYTYCWFYPPTWNFCTPRNVLCKERALVCFIRMQKNKPQNLTQSCQLQHLKFYIISEIQFSSSGNSPRTRHKFDTEFTYWEVTVGLILLLCLTIILSEYKQHVSTRINPASFLGFRKAFSRTCIVRDSNNNNNIVSKNPTCSLITQQQKSSSCYRHLSKTCSNKPLFRASAVAVGFPKTCWHMWLAVEFVSKMP